jgi:NADPH2:quinone reductase
MRAAVIHELGGDPVVEEFRDPPAGNDRARVLAAALNPVDLTIASGKLPFRRPAPPFVAGLEGVAQLPDGSHRYFSAPALPFGSVAEWVPLGEAETAAVPAGLDPAIAAGHPACHRRGRARSPACAGRQFRGTGSDRQRTDFP